MSGAGPKEMSRVACFERTEFQDLLTGNVDGAEKAMDTSVVEEVDRTAGKADLCGQLRKPLILKQSGDFSRAWDAVDVEIEDNRLEILRYSDNSYRITAGM